MQRQRQRPLEPAFVAIAGEVVAIDDEEIALTEQGEQRMVPDPRREIDALPSMRQKGADWRF